MAAAINDVVEAIESIAPKELAYEWDNTGLLVKCSDSVENLLITLDVTPAVIEEAVSEGCDMILSHHPLIYSAMKTVRCDEYISSLVMQLVGSGISLYCAHTSFDRAQGGINDELCRLLGLTDVETIGGEGEDLMRIGSLESEISGKELAELVKEKLGCKYAAVSDEDFGAVKSVAVIGGSGGDFIAAAKSQGANALVTGEAKHSHLLEARGLGVLLIAAGHYETEKHFTDVIFSSLHSRLNEVQLHLGLKKASRVCAPGNIV